MNINIERGEGIKVGVYKIYHHNSNKLYIGGSYSSFTNRASIHKGDLQRGDHHSIKLQRAWNKYGSENFTFSIVEAYSKIQFSSKEEMRLFVLDREQYWLDKYPKEIKYNIVEKAGSNVGFKHSEEFKKWKSEQYKGRKQHPNTYKAIIASNTGRKHTLETREKLSRAKKGIVHSRESIEKRAKLVKGSIFKNRRQLMLCDTNYNIIKFYPTSDIASIDLGLSSSNIRTKAANCKGKNNWILMYEWYPIINKRSIYKPVIEIDRITEEVIRTWNSAKEIATYYKISEARIKHILTGDTKQVQETIGILKYK